jgi:hypothetical protein
MIFKPVYIWITCLIILFYPMSNLFSQRSQSSNAVYIEVLGPGVFYSVNYERCFSEMTTVRIGLSTWEKADFSFVGIPLLVNYLVGQYNSKLELGIGIEYVNIDVDIGSDNFLLISGTGSYVMGVGSIGYRYQPLDGGMHFRFVLNPMLIMGEMRITAGMSIGVSF